MKNYLKSLMLIGLFAFLMQSCTEKQNLQKNEFEYQNILEDNKSLLNEVNIIVSQYDEVAHKLRMKIIESKNCSKIKEEFINLSNEQKAMVWKDRIISDLKIKNFNIDDYYYLSKLYNLIDSKSYVANSKENNDTKNAILSLWKESIKEKIKTTNLSLTLLSLTDSLNHISIKKQKKSKSSFCNCSWGGTCSCQWVLCKMTPGGCGIMGYWNCIKGCQYPQ